MPQLPRVNEAAALMLATATLASAPGCRPGDDEGGTSASQGRASTQQQSNPVDPLAHMVSAVSASRVAAPVELKFSLDRRPEVGKPIDVQIAVLPVSELTRIGASFSAGTGLELKSGEQMPPVDRPPQGVPLSHRITIVPERDGIFFVSAVVLADSAEQSLTRTFSIPIIAGQGAPPAAASESRPKPR